MKKLITILAISILTLSCSKNDCLDEKMRLSDKYQEDIQKARDLSSSQESFNLRKASLLDEYLMDLADLGC